MNITCCQAISKIFEFDTQYKISLEANFIGGNSFYFKNVQRSELFENRNRSFLPQVLRTFLSLPLRVHKNESQATKLAAIVNA